jgi:hypothetical protein
VVVEDAGRSTPAAASQTLAVARREISGGRLARQAGIIKTPLLLIAGEEDRIVDPQAVGVWARSVEQAEICLLDGCGHLPMIERTAEFNARILAFLTGDARYLDYVVPPSEAEEEEAEYEEVAAEVSAEEDEAPALPTNAAGSSEAAAERRERPPNIVRKQGGRYPARTRREPHVPPSGDGVESDRWVPSRAPSGEDLIPELPEDLFDWPDARNEVSPIERPQSGSPEEPGDEDPEDPPRPR